MSRVLPVLGAAALLPLALALPASAQAAGAQVTILHGIPDTPVDVYVDGELLIDDFEPLTAADPLTLPEGTYEVAIFGADATDDSGTPVIGPANLEVPASGNLSAIAHLTEAGEPTLTPFVNDTDAAAAGQGRVVVRHTAAAPTVDVLVGGTPTLTGITNPGEATADLPAATLSDVTVAAAGTTEAVIGPVDVPVVAGQATIVYAVGSLEDDTLDVLVQTVALAAAAPAPTTPAPGGTGSTGGSTPAGVPAGNAGLVDDSAVPAAVALAGGLGLLVAAGGGVSLARARRQQ